MRNTINYSLSALGAKSRTASASVSIAAVSETQCTSSNNSGGSSSQQVDSSDPETAGMEVDDVARQQMALLLSLHQAESMHGELWSICIKTIQPPMQIINEYHKLLTMGINTLLIAYCTLYCTCVGNCGYCFN